ncbi:hypothetical protein Aperf_G00000074670 [Anoplocephala perfoliata]
MKLINSEISTGLLVWIYFLLTTIQLVKSGSNVSHLYIFLREEEVPIGRVILSASRAMYLAKVYAKRGIYTVLIEEPIDPSPEFFYPENLYSISKQIKYFSISEHTGLVKVIERLDFDNPDMEAAGCIRNEARETIELLQQNSLSSSRSIEYCCFPVEITGNREESLALHICIEDVNDNAPIWNMSLTDGPDSNHNGAGIVLSIPETLPLGSAVDFPSATDLDSGLNGALTYEIWPTSPEFEIVWNSTTSKLCLYLKKELDRETESSYNFTVVARDKAVEPRSGSIMVAVNVEDVNDNDPVFEEATYYVTIPESTAISTPIIQISLTIGATDKGDLPRQSTCLVEINLTDENDNAPKLLFEPGNLTNFALVPENEIAGRIVAVFTVVDEDSGVNADTVCWISSVNSENTDLSSKAGIASMNKKANFRAENIYGEKDSDVIDIDNYFKLELMALPFAKVYQLSTVAVFDREAGGKYRVAITCADKGVPSQNTTGYVLVRIQDVNDHAPAFPNGHFTYRLAENHPVGSTLFKLTAEDLDEGENALVSYSIFTTDGTFTINNKTGEVSLAQPLDYEKHTTHNFTVLAIDGGESPLTGTVAVTVYVDDVNDNAPVVTSGLLLTALENHSASVPVGTLAALDADSGLNGFFYFKITSIKPCFCSTPSGGEKTSDFNGSLCSWALEMINKCDVETVENAYRLCSKTPLTNAPSFTSKEFLMTERGDVYLRYPNLDRETVPVYLIQGAVTDRGQPPQKSTFCITVVINDVNDCHPKFTFPALTNNTVLVRLPIHRGEPLIQLHATDYDIFENGEVRFGFAEETEDTVANLFAVHPKSGLMVSKYSLQLKDLDFLAPSKSVVRQTFTVKIKVTDMGSPPLVSYASLRVRFQTRLDTSIEQSFPSLQEQLLMEQQRLKNNEPYLADLFDESLSVQAEPTRSSDRAPWRSSIIFIILCAFFLVLLLVLAILLLAIFARCSMRPPPSASNDTRGIPSFTTASATLTSRRPLSSLLVSPLHHHQNHNYQRCGSSPTLPYTINTPCHSLPLNFPRSPGISASGDDLSLNSSAV